MSGTFRRRNLPY